MDNFAVFILTHGRPDKVATYKTLRKQGYTGDIYIIVDNEDATVDRYKELYGEQVIVFDKQAIAQTFDDIALSYGTKSVVYARNACFQIARDLGIEYFLQLDDDYGVFKYRFNPDFVYEDKQVRISLDRLFSIFLDYYKSIPALSIALAQGGDFIGGRDGGYAKLATKRKVMNTFFCSTQRPFNFVGILNDDVNTYVSLGNRGALFLTILQVYIDQKETQFNTGGLTDLYLDSGTYVKSFYTVMFQPSSVNIWAMGSTHLRLHHRIEWNNTVPKIVSEAYRKQS